MQMPSTHHALWSAGKPKRQHHRRSSLLTWETLCRHIRRVAVVAVVALWHRGCVGDGCVGCVGCCTVVKCLYDKLDNKPSPPHSPIIQPTAASYLAVIFIINIFFVIFRISSLSNSGLLLPGKFTLDCWKMFYIFYRDLDEPKVWLDKYCYKCSILLLCVVQSCNL